MSQAPIVPFLSKSTLFILGMTAQCPPLHVVMAFAAKEERVDPARRDRIIERLLRRLPYLPMSGDAEALDALARIGPDAVDPLRGNQSRALDKALHRVWSEVASDLDDEADRRFAEGCAVILTEIYRLSSRAA